MNWTKDETKDGIATFYAPTQKAWRTWLAKNGNTAQSVWLVIFRKSSETKSVTYEEAVAEALCYGWIDSKPNKRDEESFYQFFARRKPKSGWSKVNKDRIEKLLAAGKMAPAGLAAVELAKANGAWTSLDSIEKGEVPEDLQQALAKNKSAATYFDAFPKSVKRGILEWIQNAKRPETRQKRIAETLALAEKKCKSQSIHTKNA